MKRKGTVRGSNIKKKLNKKTRFTINRKVRRQGKIRRLPINNSTSHGTVKIGARRMKNITQHKKINKKTPVIVYREKVAL